MTKQEKTVADFKTTIIKLLEQIAARGFTLSRVFDDWLELMLLSLQTVPNEAEHTKREEQYLKIIHRYPNDLPKGQREADLFAAALRIVMQGMQATNDELIGEVYEQLALNYKGFGQFFTPKNVCKMMAQMTSIDAKEDPSVLDPCCGSGRLLVEAYKLQPNGFFVGQDIAYTCVKMTALNFLFFNMDGLVIWGDSLKLEAKAAYRTIRTAFGGQLFVIERDSEHWAVIEAFVKPAIKKATGPAQAILDQYVSQEECF